MSERRLYEPKKPFDILKTLLRRADENFAFSGTGVLQLLEGGDQPPRELDVRLPLYQRNKFMTLLQDVSFLRAATESKSRTGDVFARIELSINSTEFALNVHFYEPRERISLGCDFTLDNLALAFPQQGKRSSTTSLSLRYPDPTGRLSSTQFFSACMRDMYHRRLVPMCPDKILRIDEKSTPDERRAFVALLMRCVQLMEDGWTLSPSLSGKTLDYQPYAQPVGDEEEKCTICLEPLKKGVMLVCNHSYHLGCLARLMQEDGPKSYRCPLCNKAILFSGQHALGAEAAELAHSQHEDPMLCPHHRRQHSAESFDGSDGWGGCDHSHSDSFDSCDSDDHHHHH